MIRLNVTFALTLVAGCRAPPTDVLDELMMGVEAGDAQVLDRLISSDYGDPRGDKRKALAEIKDWFTEYPARSVTLSDVEERSLDTDRQREVIGAIDLQMEGSPGWRTRGLTQWTFEGQADFRLTHGLFEATRDAMEIVAARRAALEGNDAEALRPWLHPAYADGDLDGDEAIARLAQDVAGRRIRLRPHRYRVELRGIEAHLDEHYDLEIDGQTLSGAVARLTLERSAGHYRIRAGLYRQKPQGPLDAGKSLK